jgi:hypothetical protein
MQLGKLVNGRYGTKYKESIGAGNFLKPLSRFLEMGVYLLLPTLESFARLLIFA